MQLSDLPLMLTVDEAADVLRIGRNLMYEAVSARTVASVRIGRTIRIPRQSLATLLDGETPATTAQLASVHGASVQSARLQ